MEKREAKRIYIRAVGDLPTTECVETALPKAAPPPTLQPNIKLRDGYEYIGNKSVHRLVYEEAYGKCPHGWHVHHVNFNKRDNRLENLIAMPENLHVEIHRRMKQGNFKYTKDQIQEMIDPWIDRSRKFKAEAKKLKKEIKEREARLQIITKYL